MKKEVEALREALWCALHCPPEWLNAFIEIAECIAADLSPEEIEIAKQLAQHDNNGN